MLILITISIIININAASLSVIREIYDGSIDWVHFTHIGGSGSIVGAVSDQKCYSNPCLRIHAGSCGASCYAQWDPVQSVSAYNSLQIQFRYYHNGLGSDGTRECHFEYTCDGVSANPFDFPGQAKYLYGPVDISNCAGKPTLSMNFYCTGGNGNPSNLYVDDFVLTGTADPMRVIRYMYDGSANLRAEASFTGSGSNVYSSMSNSKCYSNPCLQIHAGSCGTSCWAQWSPAANVAIYDSLQIQFRYYHNGLGSDGTRECHFEYICDGVSANPVDLAGQKQYLYGPVDISNCAGKPVLYMHFHCTGGNGNPSNLYVDDFVLTGTVRPPTLEPSKSPSRNPSKSPTRNPSVSPIIIPATQKNPSSSPTKNPSISPTGNPSKSPTGNPSKSPTGNPSKSPIPNPGVPATGNPSISPTDNPSTSPISNPGVPATGNPSTSPTGNPSTSPTGNPSMSPTENPIVPPIEPATPPRCDGIDGNAATVSGKSHIKMWNSAKYTFDGDKQKQYYYMHPCHGEDRTSMPLSLTGFHRQNGLEYVTLELYDDEATRNVIWFNSGLCKLKELTVDVADTRLPPTYNTDPTIHDIKLNKMTDIGDRFVVMLKDQDKGFRLIIEDKRFTDCKLILNMVNQEVIRTRLGIPEFLTIQPPECYRCVSCGLLGDFRTEKNKKKFQDCNGDKIDAKNNVDKWLKSDVDKNCNGRRRLQDNDTLINDTLINDTIIADKCINNETVIEYVLSQCQSAKDAQNYCCNDVIGGNFCSDLEEVCYEDSCIISDGNLTSIPIAVDGLFTNIVQFVCSFPDIGEYYDPNDLIWRQASTTSDLPEWLQSILDRYGIEILEAMIIGGGVIILCVCCVCIGCCYCRRGKMKRREKETATAVGIELA